MSDFTLAFIYLRSRPLVTLLTVFSVALGLGLATMVLVLSRQTMETLSADTGTWDLVVGAKGSPLQLVLNGLYFIDAPTGNTDIAVWQELQTDPGIAKIVPLTMGDNYLGWPIVGTTPELFADRPASRLATGRLFAKPFEVVAGAEVARQQRLQVGRQIIGAHGWGKSTDLHPEFPYTVVGILAPTGSSLDRAVFTDYHSTWEVHRHHDEHDHDAAGHDHHDHDEEAEEGHDPTHEVTSLLVRLHQPGYRFRLVQEINRHQMAMAAAPVDEISKLAGTFLQPLQRMLLLVAYLVIIVSALSILISLYLTIDQRRRDLAILRALGGTRGDVFRLITLEAALLSGGGVLLGWLLGHGALHALTPLLLTRFGIGLHAWQLQPAEGVIAGSVWVLGILAGLLPAVIAYRLPVAETLVKE